MTVPILLHIPHASTAFPAGEEDLLLVGQTALQQELLRMTDWYTDDLFQSVTEPITIIASPYSRLLVDVERFEHDDAEPMAGKGMGAIYTRTSQGQPLRPDPLLDERYRLIETYYRPHHRRLTSAVSNALAAYGTCLIIDAHSFPSTPLPCDLDQNPIRPDFCVGTDAFHTPDRVAGQSHDYFASHGFSVGIDRPYCGSIVPLPYYRKDERVRSVMLEVNRRLYMDETTGQRSEPFEEVRRLIEGWMLQIGDAARHASGRQPNGKVAGP